MVKVTLQDSLHIHIESPDRQYYDDVKEFFSFYVPGYIFMPRYQNSTWDGQVSLFNYGRKSLPAGLFFDFLKFHKQKFQTEPLEVSPEVKALFTGVKLKPKFDLKLYPYGYQEDCIRTALKHKRCILHVSTASGKSNIITYIVKTLLEKWKNNQYLIIVPTINLVEQFYTDMVVEYGIDKALVGRVYDKIKQPDRSIVVSTWQSLSKHHEWLDRFHGVIVDEVWIAKLTSGEIKKILAKAVNAEIRLGLTGTLPDAKLDLANIKSYLGPVVRRYSAKELSDDGYVSQCHILAYYLQYQQEFYGEYFDVRREVFSNPARLKFIRDTVDSLGYENILILVNLVEKEGKVLEAYLTKHMPDRDVIFIYGNTKVKDREHHRKDFENRTEKNKVVIATYPVYKMGVNIPSLKHIMLGSPLKSKISVLQSVGRVLRKHLSKEDGGMVHDLIDIAPYLESHGDIRLKYYKKEGFDIEEKKICLPATPDMIY